MDGSREREQGAETVTELALRLFPRIALDCQFPTQSTAYFLVSVEQNSLAIKAANMTTRRIAKLKSCYL
ncbi:hypothetical protein GO003_014265 [Methylicorpusculum oleiharenae]|uniref:hypothetical protein n=1 Tax=Methylicorpusculum oleiharenae TaxID=1338687 RepID=UPI00135AF2C7|nr:hypothetical protein [Methylicorpusculum oleiharenae]MCD2451555.1 hypothetical protein [Methylicorpusculum oleiharenae]